MERVVRNQIEPPWISFPGFPPGDCFWRQSGELWFVYVWKPFWDLLSASQKDEYLKDWDVPFEWKKFYLDDEFQKWLETTGD
ncbi:MAG: hypothetical protein LCH30_10810 [Proteobacteria bacterium]|nr:hypothetical protein [Pseudomonadota bacterium]